MKLSWLLALILTTPVLSALINVTVDNKYGDPRTGAQFVYSPNGAWYDGPGCTTCQAQPDPSQAYNGTWVDSTFNSQMGSNPFPNAVPTASINFTGSALYVYCIMAPLIGPSFLTFLLDGQVVGSYSGQQSGSIQENIVADETGTYEYKILVYANNSFQEGTHSFMLQNGVVNGPLSIVLFDYLTYSTQDLFAGPPESSGNPVTSSPGSRASTVKSSRVLLVAVIFGTTGALLFVILIAILFHRLVKRSSFSDIKIPSLRLPSIFLSSIFRRGRGPSVKRVDPPSFSPSRLVRRTVPEPSESMPSLDLLPQRRVPPVHRHHSSLPATTRNAVPLAPRRRRDMDMEHSYTFLPMTLQSNGRNSSLVPEVSCQDASDFSEPEPDIMSIDPPSSDEAPPPHTAAPLRNQRAPRRLTVRNK